MHLRMWMYDLAREQSPTLDHLRALLDLTQESGYNAIGLYLEHRFAYLSTPWAHGKGCVTPDMVGVLRQEYPSIQIVPFINLLGHFEGMLYTEFGKQFAEERFAGMQACPCNEAFNELCGKIVDETIEAFGSQLIHIGGDETWQLGKCPRCAERVRVAEEAGMDGKAVLYGEHFGALARRVAEKGRIPAVWGDMFLEHPQALECLPRETVLFDWQYFESPKPTSKQLQEAGFRVVCCPTIHTYNSTWMHLTQAEENVRLAYCAATEIDAEGVCVTTWECGLFGNYETLKPAISACASEKPALLDAYAALSPGHGEWAKLMGIDLPSLGGPFAFGPTRSSLKVRLLLAGNPFLAWLHHGDELCGEIGGRALALLDQAVACAPNINYRGVSEFIVGAIAFARHAERARIAYRDSKPGLALTELAVCRQVFENLEKIATANHLNAGGSLADIERCIVARDHVEKVMRRIKQFGDGSLGYLPAFEVITHQRFVPHDQGCWWLINRWANE